MSMHSIECPASLVHTVDHGTRDVAGRLMSASFATAAVDADRVAMTLDFTVTRFLMKLFLSRHTSIW